MDLLQFQTLLLVSLRPKILNWIIHRVIMLRTPLLYAIIDTILTIIMIELLEYLLIMDMAQNGYANWVKPSQLIITLRHLLVEEKNDDMQIYKPSPSHLI